MSLEGRTRSHHPHAIHISQRREQRLSSLLNRKQQTLDLSREAWLWGFALSGWAAPLPLSLTQWCPLPGTSLGAIQGDIDR